MFKDVRIAGWRTTKAFHRVSGKISLLEVERFTEDPA